MPHDHARHHHQAGGSDVAGRRLWAAVALNLALTVAQIAGGILSGSLALIADALHNLSDAASLVIAAAARRVARRPADAAMTFGYARAETVAALVNYTTLILLGVWLGAQAVGRFFAPEPIDGWIVVIVASVALAVDVGTAALTFASSRDSMNIRAAFLHKVSDALASVAVIAGGAAAILYGWTLVDPIVTLLIASYVVIHGALEIGGAIRVLMLGAPPGIDPRAVAAAMEQAENVREVHHLHLWMLDERRVSLEAHVVLEDAAGPDPRPALRARLREAFGVGHVTLEAEAPDADCASRGAGISAGDG